MSMILKEILSLYRFDLYSWGNSKIRSTCSEKEHLWNECKHKPFEMIAKDAVQEIDNKNGTKSYHIDETKNTLAMMRSGPSLMITNNSLPTVYNISKNRVNNECNHLSCSIITIPTK